MIECICKILQFISDWQIKNNKMHPWASCYHLSWELSPGYSILARGKWGSRPLSNLPSPRNSECAGIPAELHGVPQLFLYHQVENAQEVPNDSKQMYSCAQTKINSREPSLMVRKYSSLQAMHIKLFFMQFLRPEVENEQCHCHRYRMLN